ATRVSATRHVLQPKGSPVPPSRRSTGLLLQPPTGLVLGASGGSGSKKISAFEPNSNASCPNSRHRRRN
ncbi:hypothetical protein HK100_009514, partial [Physocladia obscura]